MKSVSIKLSTVQDIRDFVNITATIDEDIDLSSGRYVVDAKSIMGIFSLDLLSDITLTVHADNADDIIAKFDKFIVK